MRSSVCHVLIVLAFAAATMSGVGAARAQAIWDELTQQQQVALAPLADQWTQLSLEQQYNWIAVSRHYARMTPDERQMLQERMSQWAALTPRQRNQARFDFNAIKSSLSAEERRAKWEEYRNLPEAERQRLARNRRVLRGAAPALRPPLPGGLVKPPALPSPTAAPANGLAANGYGTPRPFPRAVIPADHNTLLPKALLEADNRRPPPARAPVP